MNDDKASAVSALIDGELPRAQAERAVDALLSDPALRTHWQRCHSVSDALAGRYVAGADSLADRVRTAIEADPVPFERAPRAAPRWRIQPWTAAAMAASVAAAALLIVLALDTPLSGDQAPLVAVAPSAQGADTHPSAGVVPVAATSLDDANALTRLTWNDPRPGVAARLNSYLLNHNQYQSTGVQGMLPYARVVGYEPND